MLPKCPSGHDFAAFSTTGFAERRSIGGIMAMTAPIYCLQCGHVYSVASVPEGK